MRLGQSILVTDRGVIVTELLPPGRGQGDALVPAGLRADRRVRQVRYVRPFQKCLSASIADYRAQARLIDGVSDGKFSTSRQKTPRFQLLIRAGDN